MNRNDKTNNIDGAYNYEDGLAHLNNKSYPLEERFEAAVDAVDLIKENVSLDNDDILAFYGLFKQVRIGDISSSRPTMFDPVGRAKWDAWNRCKGKSKDDAKEAYIQLLSKFSQREDIQPSIEELTFTIKLTAPVEEEKVSNDTKKVFSI